MAACSWRSMPTCGALSRIGHAAIGTCLAKPGSARRDAAEVWDEFRRERLDAPPDRLTEVDFPALLRNRMPAAISRENRRASFDCSFGAMDANWTAIASTEDLREIVRPD